MTELEILIGCVPDQQDTIRKTIPGIGAAALYADKLSIVTREADTLTELISTDGGELFFEDWFNIEGADSQSDNSYDSVLYTQASYWQRYEELESQKLPLSDIENDEVLAELEKYIDMEEIKCVMSLVSKKLNTANIVPFIYDPQNMVHAYEIDLGRLATLNKRKSQVSTQLGVGLPRKIPGFDGLTIQQILELRSKSQDYLGPFRSYVVETSRGLEDVGDDVDAWSDLINEVYIGKTLPALLELQGKLADNTLLKGIITDFKDGKSLIGSAVSFGIGYFTEAPLAATISGVIGLEALSRITRIRHAEKSYKKDKLYFLANIQNEL